MKPFTHVRSALTGLSDGLTIPLAVAAGATGTGATAHTIINLLAITTAAGALLLGFANFLTIREEQEGHLHEHHFDELDALPETEKKTAIAELNEEQTAWQQTVRGRLATLSPFHSAATVFVFYGFGGTVMLLPFMLTGQPGLSALYVSAAIGFSGLLCISVIKNKLDNRKWLSGSFQSLLVSLAAIAAVFAIARLIVRA